jgi:hypothetical protein
MHQMHHETQNRLGQSETLVLFFNKNKFKDRFVFHTTPFSPTLYSLFQSWIQFNKAPKDSQLSVENCDNPVPSNC